MDYSNNLPAQDPNIPNYPVSTNKTNQTLIFVIVILLLVIVGGGGFIIAKYFYFPKPASDISTQQPVINQSTANSFSNLNTEKASTPLVPTDELPGWKTYTTNPKMDVDEAMYRLYPGLKNKTLTFKYPASWTVSKSSKERASYIYKDTSINLGFELRKDDPEKSPCQSEGPCENFADITIRLGVVPKGLANFDPNFWGRGYPIVKETQVEINGTKAAQAYGTKDSPFPMGTVFFLNPGVQVYAVSEFFNYNDVAYQKDYSKTTAKEINQILSTFKFLP